MMFFRPSYGLAAALSVLLLSGCADGVSDVLGVQKFKAIVRGDDNTLTSAEKEAAISELQAEKERQQAQAGQSGGAPKTN